MEIKHYGNSMKIRRVLSGLDKFVIGFVKILNGMKIKYVIVSGYVAILFGRTRGTEDIDIFIGDIGRDSFHRLVQKLEQKKLWIVNTSSEEAAYRMLKDGDSIRVAEKNRAIPNIEMKISKENEMKDCLKAVINGFKLFISPIENQIAFKFYLGSEKDIEDAVYLYELFKGKLNAKLLVKKCKELNVLGIMNKYVK